VVVEPRSPQPAFPLHEHDFHELVIVASGSGWHVLNGEPHLLSCGEVLYLAPEDRHSFEQVHDLCLTNVIYRPNGALLHSERLRPLQPSREEAGERRYWQVSEETLGRLEPLLSALARECRQQDRASQLMAESLLVQLLVTLWRERLGEDGRSSEQGCSALRRLVHVLAYLRHNCTRSIDLDEVAERFGYSPRNFRRIFRDATATTPHDYLVKLRLCRAMRALRASDASVTAVALESGFNDGNYFSSAFRKQTGMSPSRYRREARSDS